MTRSPSSDAAARDLLFDAALRARHAEALGALSPRVRAQLAQRRAAALRGQAARPAPALRWRPAVAAFAAAGALALGLQLHRAPAPGAAAPVAALATADAAATTTAPATSAPATPLARPRADTLLDQDPEFFAWLGSADARRLAME
ncbi:hypothetical protein [Thermomonas flagellata]|uniref:hypothetical protein n=1 Tax=Thermomonas flagellata TaxID=2888524 RepID=UPI001F0454EF|nr:hypothetical protein [Thermomonas flagellata]